MQVSLMLPALLGMLLGTALQLQQPSLWSWTAYAAMLPGALLAWAGLALSARGARWRTAARAEPNQRTRSLRSVARAAWVPMRSSWTCGDRGTES